MKNIQITLRAAAAAALTCAAMTGAHAAPQHAPKHAQASCPDCGVVLSVTPVQRTEKTQGMAGTPVTPGMAIGGVVGGLVGNQIGHGNGRAAATALGVAGGAYAGHAIEKKKYTAYVMKVRMNDGSVRTVEQRTALAKGSHVVVEGGAARPRNG